MEEMTYCSNCEKDISKAKYILHERFCSQNVKKCSLCKVPINIDDEDDHFNEYHSELACNYCKKNFSKEMIDEHRKNCDQIMEECIYCTIQVCRKDKNDHELICGAETEQCSKCLHYISKKDLTKHNGLNCCPDELEVSKQLVYIDQKNNKKRDKKDKPDGNKEINPEDDNKIIDSLLYGNGNKSSNNKVNPSLNSKASYKKFDMQVSSTKNKELVDQPQAKTKKQGLGKHISKPGFVKNDNKWNINTPIQPIEDRLFSGKDSKPQIIKMTSFKNISGKKSIDTNDITKQNIQANNRKKKKKKQFLPLSKYDKIDVSGDEYEEEDYTSIHKNNPYNGISSKLSQNNLISKEERDMQEAIKRSIAQK